MALTPSSPFTTSFLARREAGGLHVEGPPHALFGHRRERPGEPVIGNWAEWRWDGHELLVHNDRFGAYAVYYHAGPDVVAVSPSIDLLLRLGVPRDLDLDAIAAFLGVGYFLGQDTAFLRIRALPPGGSLRWTPGSVTFTGGPRPLPVRPATRETAMDGIIEGLRIAVARCIPDDRAEYLMPLSGGRDSRHLLLELRRQGHPPASCVTASQYPHLTGSPDVRHAGRLCAALGLPHRRLHLPGRLVAAEIRKNRLTSYCTDEHTWSLALAQALGPRVRHTYDGLPGGVFLQRPWERKPGLRESLEAGRLEELADALLKTEDGEVRFIDLVSPSARRALSHERARERVRSGLQAHLTSADPLLAYRFWNRALRELPLVATRVLGRVPTVFTPYLDPDLVDFAASLPWTAVGTDVHSEAIARAFPEVAGVPFAPLGRPRLTPRFVRSVSADLARLLLRYSDGSLVDRRALLARAVRGVVRGDDWLARGRRPALITYLVQLEHLAEGAPLGATSSGAPGAERGAEGFA